MTKTCNICGSKLMVAFEQLGRGTPYYLAICSGLFRCKSVAWDVCGKGDTEEEAVSDYHARIDKAFSERPTLKESKPVQPTAIPQELNL